MLRCKILSNKDNLDKLNAMYKWLPNNETIRPNPKDLLKKKELTSMIEKEWLSLRDYVLHTIFQLDFIKRAGLKFVINTESTKKWIFSPSLFRYNLIESANHYILWNYEKKFYDDFPDEIINEIIEKELKQKLNHNNFNFAWYKNPKPTIIDFYHVQVFWIEK